MYPQFKKRKKIENAEKMKHFAKPFQPTVQ